MDKEIIQQVYEIYESEAYIKQDMTRWANRLRIQDNQDFEKFERCFKTRQEFRSIVNYRISRWGDTHLIQKFNSLMSKFASFAFVQNLYLSCKDIGPGLYIEHGFSTIIFAKEIGENFHINQCVTIGSGKGGIPKIGDKVSIHCNSVVIGGIEIGNNVTVAAGSTLVDSVPSNSVVASPKATIVRQK